MDKKEFFTTLGTAAFSGAIYGIIIREYSAGIIFAVSYMVGYTIVSKIRKR